MSTGIFFTIEAFIYMIVLGIIYFNKGRYKSEENSVYSVMIVVVVLELAIELVLDFVGPLYETMSIVSYSVAKLYCILLQLWLTCLCLYIVIVALKMKKRECHVKRMVKIFSLVAVIFSMLICILPVNFFYDNNLAYTYGPSVNVVYVASFLFSFIGIFCMGWNYKNIRDRRFLPLVIFLLFGGICSLVQFLNPGLLLASVVHSVITFIMYHTIENPDLKLLEEVHKSKEISDVSNEEKTLFLYNMTQDIRNTMNDIDDNADMILESSNLDEDKEYAREIKIIASKFNTMTNEMFDVSKLDAAYIKVYNSKYNIKNIFKEIVTMYNNKCKNKNIDLIVNIDHDVPEILYGDSIGLKEVLTIIMDNSVKYTKEGFIEFAVSTVIKNDICRLMITVEDSGVGIKSEDINKIKIDDKSLSKANKLMTLMNGAMMISSNYGLGTKVKVILDQKIEFNENADVVKYEKVYDNIKLLMVDDSDSGIKIIDKLIKGSNIKMDFAVNGKECVDKIKAYGKYDLILLDEQLSQISAMELIKKIKSIRNFNIPVILLSKDNTYEYNDEYKKLGFSGYLLKPVKKEDLLNKINECVKKDK